MTKDRERERIRWACRRGMLECDLFLVPFFEQCYDDLTEDEKSILERMLKESDADLILWLMETAQPYHAVYKPLLEKIRMFKKSYHSH